MSQISGVRWPMPGSIGSPGSEAAIPASDAATPGHCGEAGHHTPAQDLGQYRLTMGGTRHPFLHWGPTGAPGDGHHHKHVLRLNGREPGDDGRLTDLATFLLPGGPRNFGAKSPRSFLGALASAQTHPQIRQTYAGIASMAMCHRHGRSRSRQPDYLGCPVG